MSDDMVRDTEIQWTSEPLPHLELLPVESLFALDPVDLLEYAHNLQSELQAVRALMHESLSVVAHLTAQLDRSKQTVVRLYEALREQRAA